MSALRQIQIQRPVVLIVTIPIAGLQMVVMVNAQGGVKLALAVDNPYILMLAA